MASKRFKIKCVRLLELLVHGGYDISDIAFKPLSHFNEEGVDKWIKSLEEEQGL